MKGNLWKALVVAGMLAPWDVRAAEDVSPETAVEADATPAPASSVLVFRLGQLRSEERVLSSLVWVARRLEETPGVTSVEIRLGRRDVRVTYDETRTGVPDMVRTVEKLGFHATSDTTTRVAGG